MFIKPFPALYAGKNARLAPKTPQPLFQGNPGAPPATGSSGSSNDSFHQRVKNFIRALRDLEGHNLKGENLKGSYLSGANLKGAKLENADLTYADLRGANLSGASLLLADLRNARLDDANFEDSICMGTVFTPGALTSKQSKRILSTWGAKFEAGLNHRKEAFPTVNRQPSF